MNCLYHVWCAHLSMVIQNTIMSLPSGHDTTASGMSWILYALASHPEYQQTAREEIDDLLDGREDACIEW